MNVSQKSIVPKEVAPKAFDTLIREALDASDNPEPYSVVDAVVAGIPAGMRDDYLREGIKSRIPAVLSIMRTRSTPEIRRGVSTKQSLIRDDYWPKFLRQRIFLPDGHKFLAKATADDLRVVASQREARAREILFRAEQFGALADLMDKSRVQFLEQLDSKAAVSIMERAA